MSLAAQSLYPDADVSGVLAFERVTVEDLQRLLEPSSLGSGLYQELCAVYGTTSNSASVYSQQVRLQFCGWFSFNSSIAGVIKEVAAWPREPEKITVQDQCLRAGRDVLPAGDAEHRITLGVLERTITAVSPGSRQLGEAKVPLIRALRALMSVHKTNERERTFVFSCLYHKNPFAERNLQIYAYFLEKRPNNIGVHGRDTFLNLFKKQDWLFSGVSPMRCTRMATEDRKLSLNKVKMGPLVVENKYDGHRCQLHIDRNRKGWFKMITKSGKELPEQWNSVFLYVFVHLPLNIDKCVLDGELVAVSGAQETLPSSAVTSSLHCLKELNTEELCADYLKHKGKLTTSKLMHAWADQWIATGLQLYEARLHPHPQLYGVRLQYFVFDVQYIRSEQGSPVNKIVQSGDPSLLHLSLYLRKRVLHTQFSSESATNFETDDDNAENQLYVIVVAPFYILVPSGCTGEELVMARALGAPLFFSKSDAGIDQLLMISLDTAEKHFFEGVVIKMQSTTVDSSGAPCASWLKQKRDLLGQAYDLKCVLIGFAEKAGSDHPDKLILGLAHDNQQTQFYSFCALGSLSQSDLQSIRDKCPPSELVQYRPGDPLPWHILGIPKDRSLQQYVKTPRTVIEVQGTRLSLSTDTNKSSCGITMLFPKFKEVRDDQSVGGAHTVQDALRMRENGCGKNIIQHSSLVEEYRSLHKKVGLLSVGHNGVRYYRLDMQELDKTRSGDGMFLTEWCDISPENRSKGTLAERLRVRESQEEPVATGPRFHQSELQQQRLSDSASVTNVTRNILLELDRQYRLLMMTTEGLPQTNILQMGGVHFEQLENAYQRIKNEVPAVVTRVKAEPAYEPARVSVIETTTTTTMPQPTVETRGVKRQRGDTTVKMKRVKKEDQVVTMLPTSVSPARTTNNTTEHPFLYNQRWSRSVLFAHLKSTKRSELSAELAALCVQAGVRLSQLPALQYKLRHTYSAAASTVNTTVGDQSLPFLLTKQNPLDHVRVCLLGQDSAWLRLPKGVFLTGKNGDFVGKFNVSDNTPIPLTVTKEESFQFSKHAYQGCEGSFFSGAELQGMDAKFVHLSATGVKRLIQFLGGRVVGERDNPHIIITKEDAGCKKEIPYLVPQWLLDVFQQDNRSNEEQWDAIRRVQDDKKTVEQLTQASLELNDETRDYRVYSKVLGKSETFLRSVRVLFSPRWIAVPSLVTATLWMPKLYQTGVPHVQNTTDLSCVCTYYSGGNSVDAFLKQLQTQPRFDYDMRIQKGHLVSKTLEVRAATGASAMFQRSGAQIPIHRTKIKEVLAAPLDQVLTSHVQLSTAIKILLVQLALCLWAARLATYMISMSSEQSRKNSNHITVSPFPPTIHNAYCELVDAIVVSPCSVCAVDPELCCCETITTTLSAVDAIDDEMLSLHLLSVFNAFLKWNRKTCLLSIIKNSSFSGLPANKLKKAKHTLEEVHGDLSDLLQASSMLYGTAYNQNLVVNLGDYLQHLHHVTIYTISERIKCSLDAPHSPVFTTSALSSVVYTVRLQDSLQFSLHSEQHLRTQKVQIPCQKWEPIAEAQAVWQNRQLQEGGGVTYGLAGHIVPNNSSSSSISASLDQQFSQLSHSLELTGTLGNTPSLQLVGENSGGSSSSNSMSSVGMTALPSPKFIPCCSIVPHNSALYLKGFHYIPHTCHCNEKLTHLIWRLLTSQPCMASLLQMKMLSCQVLSPALPPRDSALLSSCLKRCGELTVFIQSHELLAKTAVPAPKTDTLLVILHSAQALYSSFNSGSTDPFIDCARHSLQKFHQVNLYNPPITTFHVPAISGYFAPASQAAAQTHYGYTVASKLCPNTISAVSTAHSSQLCLCDQCHIQDELYALPTVIVWQILKNDVLKKRETSIPGYTHNYKHLKKHIKHIRDTFRTARDHFDKFKAQYAEQSLNRILRRHLLPLSEDSGSMDYATFAKMHVASRIRNIVAALAQPPRHVTVDWVWELVGNETTKMKALMELIKEFELE